MNLALQPLYLLVVVAFLLMIHLVLVVRLFVGKVPGWHQNLNFQTLIQVVEAHIAGQIDLHIVQVVPT